MSRIYEALQKAESERRQERPEPVVAEPVSTTAVAEHQPPMPLQAEALAPAAVAEPLPPVAEARAAAPARLDISGVPRKPWTPSYTKLPALMERGSAVEQFRSLRSRLYELRDVQPLKSVLVSSGLPQEGKSFVAANLAISLARHKNSKVLLIDGDMRRYTLHQLLGCESSPGLAEYLGGKASMTEVMQRPEEGKDKEKIWQTILPNLTFIAGGNGGDRAADLSGSPRFSELLHAAAPFFDWIIVDSSPVIPVSDAVNLARSCDGVLLVARGGVTKYENAQRAQGELKASNILGFVLNGTEKQPHSGNYYGYNSESE
ncbi:MAG: CpsD/CapB family tyrosine-protein kinase [Acidobacteriota bacterium]|nr:CpsD/CapB family tyrosine-protein kinase [Acidobacteriota bacterium]